MFQVLASNKTNFTKLSSSNLKVDMNKDLDTNALEIE